MLKKLYLIRHGETELNNKKVYYGSTDCSLTENGIAQAKSLSSFFQKVNPEQIYVSTLRRSADTASLIFGGDRPFLVDKRIAEIDFGDWECKSFKELQGDRLYEEWCTDWQNTCPPRGESFMMLAGRVKDFYSSLMNSEAETALIVSHHSVLQVFMTLLLNAPIESCWHFSFCQGCYTCFEFSGDYPVLKGHNLLP